MLQVGAAVTGSVLATILIGLLGSSPEGKLAGAVVGAAIPTFATVFLSRKTLHLSFAVVITLVALVLVYGGAFAFDKAADKETFPRPGPTPTPTSEPDGGVGGGDDVGGEDGGEAPADIEVTPAALACTAAQCERKVEVSNAGDKPLLIGNVTISGDAVAEFAPPEGCAQSQLGADDRCEVEVTFVPTQAPGQRSASLEIESNDGTASVALQGEVATPDVDLGPGGNKCKIEGQQLNVVVEVKLLAGQFEGPVRVKAIAPELELEQSVDVNVGEFADITLVLQDPADAVNVSVIVDSAGKVTETNEDNNGLKRTCP